MLRHEASTSVAALPCGVTQSSCFRRLVTEAGSLLAATPDLTSARIATVELAAVAVRAHSEHLAATCVHAPDEKTDVFEIGSLGLHPRTVTRRFLAPAGLTADTLGIRCKTVASRTGRSWGHGPTADWE